MYLIYSQPTRFCISNQLSSRVEGTPQFFEHLYFQVRSCTILFVIFLKHIHTCRSIMRLEVQVSLYVAFCTLVPPMCYFFDQMQSLSLFSGERRKCHTYVTIVGHGCRLLLFFASSLVHFVKERNVFFMIKIVFEPLL